MLHNNTSNKKKDLLPFYAILRAIPNKLGGVVAMIGSLLIFLILPFVHTSKVRTNRFKPLSLILFYIFIFNFMVLMQLGGLPIEEPYTSISQISTLLYFAHFGLIPIIGFIENCLFSINKIESTSDSNFSREVK